ncbi:MAG: hypothetical protein U0457_10340 [Candidatus Sericytochromatia bacterium]
MKKVLPLFFILCLGASCSTQNNISQDLNLEQQNTEIASKNKDAVVAEVSGYRTIVYKAPALKLLTSNSIQLTPNSTDNANILYNITFSKGEHPNGVIGTLVLSVRKNGSSILQLSRNYYQNDPTFLDKEETSKLLKSSTNYSEYKAKLEGILDK